MANEKFNEQQSHALIYKSLMAIVQFCYLAIALFWRFGEQIAGCEESRTKVQHTFKCCGNNGIS